MEQHQIKQPLPVTLISGFLGSGKTTLLKHILLSKEHSFKCAVIVNDMASLNIDGSFLQHHQLIQQEEKLVQLQNGCICCTLREDLLVQMMELAASYSFDYLIIENTGIGEPLQVAETWSDAYLEALAEGDKDEQQDLGSTLTRLAELGGISKVARLDTCVTVVDCSSFYSCFETADFLVDRYSTEVEPSDNRTLSDLMVDQIEFANIILLNKTDLISASMLHRIKTVVSRLNPKAKLIETVFGRVDLKEVLGTGLFDFEEAATSAGWLQSLHEMQRSGKKVPKTESEEFGMTSFVYTARRPFHPQRLMDLVEETFLIAHEEPAEEEDLSESDQEEIEDEMDLDGEVPEEDQDMLLETKIQDRIRRKMSSDIFGNVLRSKGFIWIASQPLISGEWSQAGCIVTVRPGSPWFCTLSEDEWPCDKETQEMIRKDMEGGSIFGDRRQEVVFIGTELQPDKIEKALNGCLLTDSEWKLVQCEMKLAVESQDIRKIVGKDPWESARWVDGYQDEEEEEEEVQEDTSEAGR